MNNASRRVISERINKVVLYCMVLYCIVLYFFFYFILYLFTLCCPDGELFLPQWEIRVALSQGKPAATESRYPTLMNYKVRVGSVRVSLLHRTVTWTTGSLTYARDHFRGGLGTLTASHHITFLTGENDHNCFLCS